MPEFYRGGSRSPYGAQHWTGGVAVTTGGASTTVVSAVSLAKIKRLQVLCMLPKVSGTVQGFMAFYRQLPDTTTSNSDLAISDPQVLRPKVFVTNQDHAVYLEMYLEAITLDVGESLHMYAQGNQSGVTAIMSAKWYVERQLHL